MQFNNLDEPSLEAFKHSKGKMRLGLLRMLASLGNGLFRWST